MMFFSEILVVVLVFIFVNCNFGNEDEERTAQKISEDDAKNYLKRYGYWPPYNILRSSADSDLQAENEELLALRQALKKFQEFLGLDPTGRLDAETKEKISQPRCGVPDIGAIGKNLGMASRWTKNNLTYTILTFSEDMPKKTFREIIRKAFDMWSEIVPLNFVELPSISSRADIKIGFATGEHGDLWPFDGINGTLAHATYPPNGKIHFDDDENWVFMETKNIEKESHIDTLNIALHEIGHAIGLEHTRKSLTAIMAPVYKPTVDSYGDYMPPKLSAYDVGAARKIYGPRIEPYTRRSITCLPCEKAEKLEEKNEFLHIETTPKITTRPQVDEEISTRIPETNQENNCPDYFSAVVASENQIYIFSNSIYMYKIENRQVVKKAQEGDFLNPWNYSTIIETGYVRNGSLVLLDSQKMVYIYDRIPAEGDRFQLRNGYPTKTPIRTGINGAMVVDGKAHIFGFYNYIIYDEHFNNATTLMDTKFTYPHFPKMIKGGYEEKNRNGEKFLTIFAKDYTLKKSQIYSYDLERKKLVEKSKNFKDYLLNCV